jgi:hypothetical protein
LAQDALCQVPGAAYNRTLCIELLDPHPLHVGVEGDPGVVHEEIATVRLPFSVSTIASIWAYEDLPKMAMPIPRHMHVSRRSA